MKTDVEELTPTRVKLTVEVPFEELKPNLDKAYKEISKQVNLKGFRPGRVPAQLIDRYVGRGAVLQEAVNDALPQLYLQAVVASERYALGQPEVEVTNIDDGSSLAFTAEVDVRPQFELPDYDGMPVTVTKTDVTPDEVEDAVSSLRDRFATLTNADRPAEEDDFVSIDLSAKVDGEDVDDLRTTGYSYQVGSKSSVDGLDDTLVGMSAGDVKTFPSKLVGGDRAGEDAEITVTVHSVKVRELPEVDDDFAQMASEFDTIGELRADVRSRLERNKRVELVGEARDKALEALMERVDIPLPESAVEAEVKRRNDELEQQLGAYRLTMDTYLTQQKQTREEYDEELAKEARDAVKGGFILDELAQSEELTVDNDELSNYVVQNALRMGVQPDVLARYLQENDQIPALVSEIVRNKALNLVVEHVTVTDEDGNAVDIEAIMKEEGGEDAADLDAEADEDHDHDHGDEDHVAE